MECEFVATEVVQLMADFARLVAVESADMPAGKIVGRNTLIDALWDCGEDGISENALSVTVKRLRDKLGGSSIRTIYGLGYLWKGDDE